ncbi:MAG TPA: ATP-binding cassette domain-containing protein, partial [Candidatus Hodarchaeales archaeon]|nr:ATP-binding cassette domain-containing protein [Candidatus Hodarchaeales archaeon]
KSRGLSIFIQGPIWDIFRHSITILVLLGGIYAVLGDRILITTIFFFYLLLDHFFGPLTELIGNYSQLAGAFAAMDRMLSIVATTERKEIFGVGITADGVSGEIEFKNVNFRYRPELPVLIDITLHIFPGERIAVVGHTGAGKTSLISLLLRFYDLDPSIGCSGSITIDGRPITSYQLESLRKNIGLVSQNIFLFNGTIRDNLKLANEGSSDNDIWGVLEMLQASNFVRSLPGQLDYVVGERGKRLSVGQRQLLSLARVVLANAKIMILDEATASIDLYTEAVIQEAIGTVMKGRTSIAIAHRLTTVVTADRIFVLDGGRIVESGSHNDLLKRGSLYADIFETYFKHQTLHGYA